MYLNIFQSDVHTHVIGVRSIAIAIEFVAQLIVFTSVHFLAPLESRNE